MPPFKTLPALIKIQKLNKKPLYILCLMLLFWALFDGTLSYITPILINEHVKSATLMGLIIASSSVSGALFDIIACQIFKNTLYRRLYLLMFAICVIYPLILLNATTVAIFLVAMALWGIYYDLKNIANFDFVGRFTQKSKHSESFGLIQIFQALGYLLAPVIAGFLIINYVDFRPFVLAWIFLFVSIIFFAILLVSHKFNKKQMQVELELEEGQKVKSKSPWTSALIWLKLYKILFPVLLLTLFVNIVDSFFWVLGPLVAENLAQLSSFGGFFIAAYSLPSLIVGWKVGEITHKFGKKKTAYASLLVGSSLLSLIYFVSNPVAIIFIVFIASLFLTVSWPSICGAYADYISETAIYEKEIEGLEDLFVNFGYIVGPVTAGFLADRLGHTATFSLLGLVGVVIALVLFAITPRKINVLKSFDAG